MNRYKYIVIFFVSLVTVTCISAQSSNQDQKKRTLNFPKEEIHVTQFPKKENVWVFVMAGQSNMAGRAFVSPKDTIPNPRILTLNKDNDWIIAKAPLHRYKPNLMGLDCGLSFAKTLLKHIPDSISIALIPTAVGGTSIKQWLDNDSKKGVELLSNLKEKASCAEKQGTLKAILWHQGENDVKNNEVGLYEERFDILINIFRTYFNQKQLPIVIGTLAKNKRSKENQKKRKQLNNILLKASKKDNFINISSLKGLSTFDGYHLDAASVNKMGKRYAKSYMALMRKQTKTFKYR